MTMNCNIKNADFGTSACPKGRNGAIEWCRLIASVFVVFEHYGFPGELGEIVNCLARFAVPFFFMVSGYFVYHADESIIRKRTIGILKLNVYSTLLYLLWGAYHERYILGRSRMAWLKAVISTETISRWLINGVNPLSGHLWYLSAVFVCYVTIYVYTRWNGKDCNYSAVYTAGILLYAVHLMADPMATAAGIDTPSQIFRNALFFGIPMFSLGIFIREYRDRILTTYRLTVKKLVLIIFAGAVIGVIQFLGTGKIELPLGTLFETVALVLLLVSIPPQTNSGKLHSVVISKLGPLSTYVYVTHMIWAELFFIFLEEYSVSVLGVWIYSLARPVLVVILSVSTGIVWITIVELGRNCIKSLSVFNKNAKE